MTLLMAIDPGPHIGIAYKFPDGQYRTATLTDHEELWRWLRLYRPTHVAFETFIGSGRRDVNINDTIELVGSIRGICFVLDIPAYGQVPQTRRSFLLDARRMKITGSPHELDALAHLLLLEYRFAQGDLHDNRTSPGSPPSQPVPDHARHGAGAIRATES